MSKLMKISISESEWFATPEHVRRKIKDLLFEHGYDISGIDDFLDEDWEDDEDYDTEDYI